MDRTAFRISTNQMTSRDETGDPNPGAGSERDRSDAVSFAPLSSISFDHKDGRP